MVGSSRSAGECVVEGGHGPDPLTLPSPPLGEGDAFGAGEGEMERHVGLPAVAFTLEDTAGTVHRLGQFRGRWLLMVFHRHLG